MFLGIIFVLLTMIAASNQAANRRFDFVVYNFTCTKFVTSITTLDCDFRKLAVNHYGLNMLLMLDHQLSKDAEYHGMIHIKPKKKQTIVKFVELRLKICDTLAMQMLPIPLAKTIFNELMSKGNLPFACPIKGNVLYNVSNLEVTTEMFPSYTIIVDFNFTLNFYENQKKFFMILLQGSTLPKKL
ncbi:uncharacterized protein [Musca autumnalis]|uniref:uncharacterized protein n=1 Tax=Musca autumnalis TaxID=221902 RepID=UPI003CF519F1